jgi:hypothetical protein
LIARLHQSGLGSSLTTSSDIDGEAAGNANGRTKSTKKNRISSGDNSAATYRLFEEEPKTVPVDSERIVSERADEVVLETASSLLSRGFYAEAFSEANLFAPEDSLGESSLAEIAPAPAPALPPRGAPPHIRIPQPSVSKSAADGRMRRPLETNVERLNDAGSATSKMKEIPRTDSVTPLRSQIQTEIYTIHIYKSLPYIFRTLFFFVWEHLIWTF